jgi:membrane associated rhomboid family serine protease
MNPRAPTQNVWGWTTRPTAAFIWLFTAFFCFFVVQSIFQLAQEAPVTTFNELFGLSIAGIQMGHVWQVLSYGFLHQDILHLLLNGFLLYLVAYEVEDQIGIKNSMLLFLTGILCGGLLWLGAEHFRPHQSSTILMGSSGGVYAMIFGFIAMFPERPITILGGLRTKYIGMILTAIAVYFIIFPSSNVAHMAHLGGIMAGIVFIKVLSIQWRVEIPSYRRRHLRARLNTRQISRTEFMNKKVDPILEKIALQGMESLSPEERRILDEAHNRLI